MQNSSEMAENSSNNSSADATTGINKDLVHAKRKRMLLSEVYVHKSRKLDEASENDHKYEVFHIYELEENEATKIVPKLSTNCTEPRKIIDVLQNSTGSDIPQLQRLIEKLCAQRKYYCCCFLLIFFLLRKFD